MPTFDLDQAIDSFWQYQQRGIHHPPEWDGLLTMDQAYLIQLGMLQRHLALGARHAGWKVGLASQVIRDQFGVHEPVFGYVLEEAVHIDGAQFTHSRLIKPGIENEICVVLGTDLKGPGVTEAAALRAIASVAPAMELAENRGPFTEQITLALADNTQQKAVVLGLQTRLRGRRLDLPAVRATVLVNGQLVAEGVGEAVMGNPIRSVAWLANKLAQFEHHLEAE